MMIELDGSFEEGGGQIIRTALGLSAFTRKPFHITKIRESREKPGLKKQHLEAIHALKKLCNAEVTEDLLGSTELTFDPGIFKPQKIEIDIETAGSITLLLQSLMVPIVFSDKKTTLTIKGGTDVSWSMPFDYFRNVFVPHMKNYANIECNLIKRGYYPKGQGIVEFSASPKQNKEQIILVKQEALLAIKGIAYGSLSLQKRNVAERMAETARKELLKLGVPVTVETNYSESASDVCGIVLWSLHGTEDGVDMKNPVVLGSDCLGERNKTAEDVAKECAVKLQNEIKSGAAVDKNLADNLIPFLGILGGKIKTSEITKHTLANIYVCEKFLGVKYIINKETKEITVLRP